MRLRGGGKRKLSDSEKRLVVQAWHRANPSLSSEDIVVMFEDDYQGTISSPFVRKWWDADRHHRKPGSGGHNRTPEAHVRKAVKMCAGFKRNRDGGWKRALSPRKAERQLKRTATPVSRDVIARGLKAAELSYKQRTEASRLSKKNREGRKELDEEEGKREEEEWKPVWFTDSTPAHLQYGGNNRNDGSYVKRGERPPPRTKNKHSHFVHVYGAVCGWKLLGPYYISEGESITGERYVRDVLKPMVRDMKKFESEEKVDVNFELQQDGAGAHFAKVTTDFLKGEGVNFWLKGKWPGNSPDLSPIENVWGIMKETIYQEGEPKTIIGLKRMVGKFFKKFGADMCRKLAAGMPNRFVMLREREYFTIGK